MTLPFKKSKDRKFRCFVCGVDFEKYDEFKSHVFENHEKSKEYLTCKYCDAPVRDIRLHYKVKHPGQSVPKDGQMRAIIWYDFSGNKRKRDKSKPNFAEGYHVSPKNNFQAMHFRSGYEQEVYLLLDEHAMIVGYEVEPKDCVTPYFWDGEQRNYWPDLKVSFYDGHTEIWEIKPSEQTSDGQNQAKWHACAEMAARRGFVFKIKTEQGIERLRKEIYKQKKNDSN